MHGDTIKTKRAILLAATILAALACHSWGKIIYVDDDASHDGNGSSWQEAYKYLQDGLADANEAVKPVEIRVAQGVYRPDQGAGIKLGDREATFRLVSGVMLKGGYGGATDPDPNAWDPASYETILNGDLKGNDDFTWLATLTDNSSHIVTAIGVDETTVVEGFTIAHGVYLGAFERGGNPGPPQGGAGLYNESGSPQIRECVFTQNYVSLGYGSAVFNSTGSAARFEGCTFEGNDRGPAVVDYRSQSTFRACRFLENRSGGISLVESTSEVNDCLFAENRYPGVMLDAKSHGVILNSLFRANKWAISNSGGGRVECRGCTFEDNWSEVSGGAAYVDRGSFVDCIFRGNSAIGAGAIWANDLELRRCVLVRNSAQGDGAINCGQGRIEQCLFEGNRADGSTGALFIRKSAVVSNCTFVANRSKILGIVSALGAREPVVVTNCIFRDNTCADAYSPLIVGTARTTLRYSDTSDLPNLRRSVGEAVGNIDVDPLFVAPGYWDPGDAPDDPADDFWVGGDYHLKSESGRWDPSSENWVIDDVTSPCIDAGDPNSPVGDEPQPNGGRINMGAYGGTVEASKSVVPQEVKVDAW